MSLDESGHSFLFAALAEKHNAVIRKIREIPPWEWGGEFLELEPQVLRFLGTFSKRYPECTAFRTAHTLASALAVYRLCSRKPKALSEQERADCIAMNRDLVDEYSNALLCAYREIFNFLFAAKGNTTFDAVAEIIKAIKTEHTQTRRQIIKAINTRNIDGLDITGPRTPACRDQVLAVVVWLANPKHPQNIHHACDRTFRPIRNGYEDVERLYRWCHRNGSRIWAWVETYRLNHDIE